MADSVLERIVQRMKTDVETGKPAELRVHRSRTLPIEQDEFPAVVLYLVGEQSDRKGGEWTPLLAIDAVIAAELRVAGNPPDQVMDPYRTWVITQLMADQTMGGLAKSVNYLGA